MEDKIIACLNNVGIIISIDDKKRENFSLQDYGMDSLTFISLITELEMCFNIEIPDEYLNPENLSTFQDIVLMLKALIDQY